jgi:hypothetical protein
MRPLVRSVYRATLRQLSKLDTAEKKEIARTRYVEFLPHNFTMKKCESTESCVRRCFRQPCSEETVDAALSNAFSFIRLSASEQVEMEVLSQWLKHDPNKCPEEVGAAIISYAYHLASTSAASSPAATLDGILRETDLQLTYIAEKVRALHGSPEKFKKKKKPATKKNALFSHTLCESLLKCLSQVLLSDLKFLVLNSPGVEGFIIDKVLSSRSGSAAMSALIYCALAKRLGLTCSVTPLQQFPMVRVETNGKPLFVNLADGGKVLTQTKAVELVTKTLNSATIAKAAMRPNQDPKVPYCLVLVSVLQTARFGNLATEKVCKAQLLFLAQN